MCPKGLREDALEGGEGVTIKNSDEASWEVDDGVDNVCGEISDSCRADDGDVGAAGACIRLCSQLSDKRLTLVKDLAVDTLEFAHARTRGQNLLRRKFERLSCWGMLDLTIKQGIINDIHLPQH